MSVIKDIDIEKIAEFESLLIAEIYTLRQHFLTDEYNFKWYGRPEIIELEKQQALDRKKFFNFIKSQYDNINSILFLQEYSNYNLHEIFIKINKYKNKLSKLTEIEKKEYDIYIKFDKLYKFYNKKYDTYSYKDIKIKLKKFRDALIFTQKINMNNICDCVICMEKESNCILICKHQFHKSCLETWLKINNICPLCRSINIEIIDIEKIYEAKISSV
jgi:hypothetical protein